MENRGSADNAAKDFSRAGGIQEHDFAEEFSSDLPSTAMPSSAPSGSSPYASLSSPSAAKADDRDVAHGAGGVGDTKKLEHALPTDPRMQFPAAGFGMVDSMGRPPVVYASNSDVGPGAFPVRSARNTATSRTVRSPIGSYDSPREFTNEESKHDDGVPNSAAAGIGVYAVEAQRVPDGNEDGKVLVAEAQHLTPLKWYQRRWITLGFALLACGFAAAVVVMVVLFVRQPSAATSSSSSLTSPPTVAPSASAPPALPTSNPISSLTPFGIACNFLSISNVTKCRSTFVFDSDNGDTTTGSTIPSEIGLLTQLTGLAFRSNWLTSTIPSEIGRLTRLTYLDFYINSLNSTIPSEIGLLTQLTWLSFYSNSLTAAIPSEIGLLTRLTELLFTSNELTGTIPSEIGLLTKLSSLWFSDNELTSFIPSEIGLLSKLMVLDFTINSLTSTVPSEIVLLTQLNSLSFSSNQLTSSIPSDFGLLTQLTWLSFWNNTLTGKIPSSLCSLPSPPDIYIDCGEITCASGCCSEFCGPSCG